MAKDKTTENGEALSIFSDLVFDIYQTARHVTEDKLQQVILEHIQTVIEFDSAWWGSSCVYRERPKSLNSAYLYHLPSTYLDDWFDIQEQDTTVDKAFVAPERAISLSLTSAKGVSPELIALGSKYSFNQIAFVMQQEDITNNTRHLSLYRQGTPFTHSELALLEGLMPHLTAAADMSQIRNSYLTFFSTSAQAPVALAVASQDGLLQSAEPAFINLLKSEWPDWNGPHAPLQLNEKHYTGKKVFIDIKHSGAHCLLLIRPIDDVEQLTERERHVANLFSTGQTYKEIATELEISPHTVRYYIRTIYMKLNIQTKADLIRKMLAYQNV